MIFLIIFFERVAGFFLSRLVYKICAVIANFALDDLNGKKSISFSFLKLKETFGNFLWLSDKEAPCPGICFIIPDILFECKFLIISFPNFLTTFGSFEKLRFPITLFVLSLRTSRTGIVLIFMPRLFNCLLKEII